MNLLQLFSCLKGVHLRDHARGRHDGDVVRSRCTGCGKAMVKVQGVWKLDR